MWIVIEAHGGAEFASICLDETGDNLMFETKKEAMKFAGEECQEGIIVEI